MKQLGSIEHLSVKWGTIVGMIQDETNNYFRPREDTRTNVNDACLSMGGTKKNLEEVVICKEIVLNYELAQMRNLLLFIFMRKCDF